LRFGVSEFSKAPCRLQIGLAHISTDLSERFGIKAVKVDASSICHLPQSDVTKTVEIWKIDGTRNQLVVKRSVLSAGTTPSGRAVNNFSTFKICVNRVRTVYFGVAYAKAFIDGKWQYARHVLSENINPIYCGT
jgi:hypothetical protein